MNILLVLGDGILEVVETKPDHELLVTLDRNKIQTVGKRELGNLLLVLQVFKSTGNFSAAKDLIEKYSEVPERGIYNKFYNEYIFTICTFTIINW